jgi:hypothetical protein
MTSFCGGRLAVMGILGLALAGCQNAPGSTPVSLSYQDMET